MLETEEILILAKEDISSETNIALTNELKKVKQSESIKTPPKVNQVKT